MKIIELVSEQTMGSTGPAISSQSTTPPGQPTDQDKKTLDMTQGEILTLGRQLNLTPQEVEALGRINVASKTGQNLTDPSSTKVLSKLGSMSLDPTKLKNLNKVPPLMGLIGKNQQNSKQANTTGSTTPTSATAPSSTNITGVK